VRVRIRLWLAILRTAPGLIGRSVSRECPRQSSPDSIHSNVQQLTDILVWRLQTSSSGPPAVETINKVLRSIGGNHLTLYERVDSGHSASQRTFLPSPARRKPVGAEVHARAGREQLRSRQGIRRASSTFITIVPHSPRFIHFAQVLKVASCPATEPTCPPPSQTSFLFFSAPARPLLFFLQLPASISSRRPTLLTF